MDVKSLIHTEPLKDKSMWLAVAAPLIVLLGKVIGIDLNAESIMALLSPIVMAIGASKVKQAIVSKAVVENTLIPGIDDAKKLLQPKAPVGEKHEG